MLEELDRLAEVRAAVHARQEALDDVPPESSRDPLDRLRMQMPLRSLQDAKIFWNRASLGQLVFSWSGVIGAAVRSIDRRRRVTPSLSAVKFSTSRCRSTGLASAWMSSHGHVRAAVQQGPGLAAEDQELHGPRPGAPGELSCDEVGRARLADARLPHQRQRVADHVVGDRHLADDPLQVEDLLGRQHRLDVVGQRGRRAAGDLELLVEARILRRTP